jgi:hypothetical protein
MQIYVNNKRWISPADSNAKYPYTEMKVGDEATIVPRANINALDAHQLDHSVRQSAANARYSKHKGDNVWSDDPKTFTTRKVYLTSVSANEIKDRLCYSVTRTR